MKMLNALRPKNKNKGNQEVKNGAQLFQQARKTKYSEGETKCEDEGDRPCVKGSSPSDALDDPAWICARGSLLVEHEERTWLKDC